MEKTKEAILTASLNRIIQLVYNYHKRIRLFIYTTLICTAMVVCVKEDFMYLLTAIGLLYVISPYITNDAKTDTKINIAFLIILDGFSFFSLFMWLDGIHLIVCICLLSVLTVIFFRLNDTSPLDDAAYEIIGLMKDCIYAKKYMGNPTDTPFYYMSTEQIYQEFHELYEAYEPKTLKRIIKRYIQKKKC